MTSIHRPLRVLVGALFISTLLVAGSVRGAPAQGIIYVRHDAVGNNDGSSWADAYTDLQDALGRAQAGDEVWVAQGVYYPAPNAVDRTATFELMDGVGLYGGFAGTETERDQRDWEANVTVLSGDLDRNDMTDPYGVVRDTVNIIGDNAYHVVTGGGVAETAVLDGFTITAGKADGSWPATRGGGMYNDDSSPTLTNVTFSGNSADRGGAIYNRGSDPRLAHVTFTGNSAGNRGAGMYNGNNSNPLLTNVTFSGNSAGHKGGGIYNSTSSPALIKVAFSGNSAGSDGGGMHNSDSSSNPLLTNVIFSGNSARYRGGGMANSSSSPTLRNVTFSGNSASRVGGGIYNWFSHSNPTLINCILWGNEASQEGAEIFNAGGSQSTISYSAIEGSGGSGAGWDAALGNDGGNNIDANPLFVESVAADEAPTTAGDYRLNEGSPAIDAGINDVVTVYTDLDGNPRIVDGTGDGNAVVDLGPYEFQIPLLTIIRQGEGLVTSTPAGIDCGNACTAGFLPGTVVTLTATPDTGWIFDHWSGDCAGTGTCQVTMDEDKSVTAQFIQDEYTLEVDIGFRPYPHGFSFGNWGGFFPVHPPLRNPDFRKQDLVRMFGYEAVCWKSVGPGCILRTAAVRWQYHANRIMNGGHCDGMAVTSLRFFKDLDTPPSFQSGAQSTYDLERSNVRHHISYYFAKQLTAPVDLYKHQIRQNLPSVILGQLSAAMANDASDPTTLFVRPAPGESGHAVTPYSVEQRDDGTYWVRVYDNNHPDLVRTLIVDTAEETWSYDMGGTWGTWTGDASSHTLGIVPISEYAREPICPWCEDTETSQAVSASMGQVALTGAGQLLISDAKGQRIGYVNDSFVNEIPGAYKIIVDAGPSASLEPIYSIPLTAAYTILLDGQTLTQTATAEVTQFGPGYAAWFERITVGPTTQDHLTIATDGKQLVYAPNEAREAMMGFALDDATAARKLEIHGAEVGAGQVVTLTTDVHQGYLVFDNTQTGGGQYSIDIRQTSDTGEHRFIHADVPVSAGDTHYVGYGAWDGEGTVQLGIDYGSDGTINETVELENQTVTVYLPLVLRSP